MSSLCLVALGRFISHVFVVCLIHFPEFSNFDKKKLKRGILFLNVDLFVFCIYVLPFSRHSLLQMSDTVKADYHGLLLRSETGSQRDTKILSAVSRFS